MVDVVEYPPRVVLLPLSALAERIAIEAHEGQTDKAGHPYIDHPRRVAARLDTDEEGAVAWLHDVIEDTAVTADHLRRAGLSDEVVVAVDALTHRPGEPRDLYLARVKGNRLATTVKLADVADNADLARLALLDAPTRTRLKSKYAETVRVLGR